MKASRLATAITAAAACAAIGLIVASCSNSTGSPVAPGVTSNLAANTSPEPTPDPTPTPTPTPTPGGLVCSPGYWKTHFEVWSDLFDTTTANTLLCNLQPQCGGTTAAIRQAAQATIEAAYIAAHGSLPCSD